MTASRKDRKLKKGKVRLLNEPKDVKCELYHDNFQNFKSYNIPKAQLVLVDIPYNVGTDFPTMSALIFTLHALTGMWTETTATEQVIKLERRHSTQISTSISLSSFTSAAGF